MCPAAQAVCVQAGACVWTGVSEAADVLGLGQAGLRTLHWEGTPRIRRESRLCPQKHSVQASGGVLRRKLLSSPKPGTKAGVLQIEILFPGLYWPVHSVGTTGLTCFLPNCVSGERHREWGVGRFFRRCMLWPLEGCACMSSSALVSYVRPCRRSWPGSSCGRIC